MKKIDIKAFNKIYDVFINNYKENLNAVELKSIGNVNEYFLLRNRIIELYEEGKYSLFLEMVKKFTEYINIPSSPELTKLLLNYKSDLLEEIEQEINECKNKSDKSEISVVLTTMNRFLNSSYKYSYETKLSLFNNYLSEIEYLGVDVDDLRDKVNTLLHIDETVSLNIINREREKMVDSFTAAKESKIEQLIKNNDNRDINMINESIDEDVDAVSSYSVDLNDEEKKELIDLSSETLGYKVDLIEQQIDDISSIQDEIVSAIVEEDDLAKEMVAKNSFLNNLKLFLRISKDKILSTNESTIGEVDKLVGKTTSDLDADKKKYKQLYFKEKGSLENYNIKREQLKNDLNENSLNNKEIKKNGVLSYIKSVGNNIKNKITSLKNNKTSKNKMKQKIASILGATIISSSVLSSNVGNISSIQNQAYDSNTFITNMQEFDNKLGLDFSFNNIDDIVKKLRNSDDNELNYYISCIDNLNYNSGTKDKINDSLLYVLGLCSSNWDDNCVAFGVNEEWQQRVKEMLNLTSNVSSINIINEKSEDWNGSTDISGDSVSVSLNEYYSGNFKSLLHELEHTNQLGFSHIFNIDTNVPIHLDDSQINDAVGGLCNSKHVYHFLKEGEACFIQCLSQEGFLEKGFTTYKDINGQTLGLITLVGSNEYIEFVTENSKRESFVQFVKRRFNEQGYTNAEAEEYLILLQNSLIGTMDHYDSAISDANNYSSNYFEITATNSYNEQLKKFKKDPTKTFEDNYNKLASCVKKILLNNLKTAKTTEQTKRALYNLGIYHDHIVANSVFYANEKTNSGESLDENYSTVAYRNQDREEVRSKEFKNIYKEMYKACSDDLVEDFELPYSDFVNIFKVNGNASNFIDSVTSQNELYVWEKENNIDDLRNSIGDLPNLVEFSQFMDEGEKLFPNGVEYNTIKGTENKAVTPIYIGLSLVLGFDEFNSYLNNNSKNKESLEDFIERRFKEQRFNISSNVDSKQYIRMLQNVLINRFDHDINDGINTTKTKTGSKRATQYAAAQKYSDKKNYEYYSNIIYDLMKYKLKNAKTDEQKIEAIEYMGIYLDCVSGNEIHYDENYNKESSSKSRKTQAKKEFEGASKLMYKTYDSIDKLDEFITYDDFVEMYDNSGRAMSYYSKFVSGTNNTTEKVKQDNTSSVKEDIKDNTNNSKKENTNEDKKISASKILSDASKYMNVVLEYDIYPKEMIYGFMSRFTDLIETGKISVNDANDLLRGIKEGKMSLNQAFIKFASIDSKNNRHANEEDNSIKHKR